MALIADNQSPSYLPRLQDRKLADWGIELDHILVNLDHLKWRPGIKKQLRGMSKKLIVDPVTHKAFFANSKKQPAMQSIGYPDLEPENLYSEKANRLMLIEKSVNEQIIAGADVIIAPYLYTPDTDDIKFSINLSLLSETLIYLESKAINLPVFAKLCIGSQILTRQPVINHLFSRYCEDYYQRIEGVVVSIADFSGYKADLHHLLGFANLVHQLQSKMSVIVGPINSFGEILAALGADGLSSGLHASESLIVKQLQEKTIIGGKAIHERMYIPEVMVYLNYEEARAISYTSTSANCAINFLDKDPDIETKKRHYLNDRLETFRALAGKSRAEKITFMIDKISTARELLKYYIQEYKVFQKNPPHDNWLQVLSQASKWEDPEDDTEELEALLAEIEQGGD